MYKEKEIVIVWASKILQGVLVTKNSQLFFSGTLREFLGTRILKKYTRFYIDREMNRVLQIQHIRKEYTTGKFVQKALDDVSLNLRDNEFVAILGPSGSGKTTLLNIIGGLDRYDSGDLIINGISTKQYKDRDWDSYRNHTIGFVFQSYT